jgi:tetratricopeptide (TPR) repeat protein
MLSQYDRIDRVPMIDLLSLLDDNGWASNLAIEYTACLINRKLKKFEQAAKNYESVVSKLQKVFHANHPILLFALGDYAGFLVESGNYRKAHIVANELFETADRICPNHKKLIDAKLDFALELMPALNFEKASRLFEECLTQQEKIGKFPEQAHQGLTWCSIAFKDAEKAIKHAEALWEHRDNKTASQVAWCAFTRARACELAGQIERAGEMDKRALEEAVIPLHFPTNDAIALERLARIHEHNGNLVSAEKLLVDAVAVERRNRPPVHPRLADRLTSLARVLVKQNRIAEARELFSEAIVIQRRSLPEYDDRITENSKELTRLESL